MRTIDENFGHPSVCWWIWWPAFGFASVHWQIEWRFGQAKHTMSITWTVDDQWWPFGHTYVHQHSNFECPLAILLSVGEYLMTIWLQFCLSTNLITIWKFHHLNIWWQFGHPSLLVNLMTIWLSFYPLTNWITICPSLCLSLEQLMTICSKLLSVGEFDDHLATLVSITQTLNDHWSSFCLLVNLMTILLQLCLSANLMTIWPLSCPSLEHLMSIWPSFYLLVNVMTIWLVRFCP